MKTLNSYDISLVSGGTNNLDRHGFSPREEAIYSDALVGGAAAGAVMMWAAAGVFGVIGGGIGAMTPYGALKGAATAAVSSTAVFTLFYLSCLLNPTEIPSA